MYTKTGHYYLLFHKIMLPLTGRKLINIAREKDIRVSSLLRDRVQDSKESFNFPAHGASSLSMVSGSVQRRVTWGARQDSQLLSSSRSSSPRSRIRRFRYRLKTEGAWS